MIMHCRQSGNLWKHWICCSLWLLLWTHLSKIISPDQIIYFLIEFLTDCHFELFLILYFIYVWKYDQMIYKINFLTQVSHLLCPFQRTIIVLSRPYSLKFIIEKWSARQDLLTALLRFFLISKSEILTETKLSTIQDEQKRSKL